MAEGRSGPGRFGHGGRCKKGGCLEPEPAGDEKAGEPMGAPTRRVGRRWQLGEPGEAGAVADPAKRGDRPAGDDGVGVSCGALEHGARLRSSDLTQCHRGLGTQLPRTLAQRGREPGLGPWRFGHSQQPARTEQWRRMVVPSPDVRLTVVRRSMVAAQRVWAISRRRPAFVAGHSSLPWLWERPRKWPIS